MHTDPVEMSALQLVEAYRDGSLSPVEATRAFLARIERLDAKVNAWRFIDPEGALEMARRSEERYRHLAPLGLLDGIPMAVKDDFAVAGWSTLHGSKATSDTPARSDAPTVAGFRRHGAVFLGKTNLPEVGWKAVTDSPLTGITRNPWDPSRTPGGSSGGNAAALALRMAPLAVGSDIGGSVRIPAAFCGVVGFKPTEGRVAMDPRTKTGLLLNAGPMARTVEDVAYANEIVTEGGSTDPMPFSMEAGEALTGGDLRGVRVALSLDFNGAEPDAEIAEAIRAVAHVLEEQGAHVEEATPRFEQDVLALYERLLGPMLAAEVEGLPQDKRDEMDPGLLEAAEPWTRTTGVDFVAAMTQRRNAIRTMHLFHEKYDIVLTPTVPIAPFEVGLESPPSMQGQRWYHWTPCTWAVNLTGQPAVSIPCGFTGDGLPVGAHLVGKRHGDSLVLRVANAYQCARPDVLRQPEV